MSAARCGRGGVRRTFLWRWFGGRRGNLRVGRSDNLDCRRCWPGEEGHVACSHPAAQVMSAGKHGRTQPCLRLRLAGAHTYRQTVPYKVTPLLLFQPPPPCPDWLLNPQRSRKHCRGPTTLHGTHNRRHCNHKPRAQSPPETPPSPRRNGPKLACVALMRHASCC